jgi:hypothetical protein
MGVIKMKMLSEMEIIEIFEKLGLKNEEDRARLLFRGQNYLTNESENQDKDYYTIQLSANTRIGLAESDHGAELERDSRRN